MNSKSACTRFVAALSFLALASLAGAESGDSTIGKSGLCCHGGRSGGAGGISSSLQWLDLSPISQIVKNEDDLGRYRFDFSDNCFMMTGGMGYGGSRCGAKIGGGGWFGYKKFISSPRRAVVLDSGGVAVMHNGDTVTADSLARLFTMMAYGGLLIEKNIAIGDFSFEIGGLFGGGALIIGKEFDTKQNNSAFSTTAPADSADLANNWSVAPLLCFDIHSGVSYRLCRFMVVGVDGNILISRSNDGFNFNTDSFTTWSPGVRLRILFGNIG